MYFLARVSGTATYLMLCSEILRRRTLPVRSPLQLLAQRVPLIHPRS